jgi:MFS family permease
MSTDTAQQQQPRVPNGRERQRARAAVAVTFAANGMLVGSWAPRIPEIKSHLDLSAGSLGIALLATALGTVVAARTAGARIARHGSPAAIRVFATVYCLLAWAPAIAPNLAALWLGLFVWGAFMGSMDVAMNAQGVTVESHYGRPVLSSFHAIWSVGSFIGAVLGGLGSALHVHVAVQQLVIGAVLAAAVLLVSRAFLAEAPHEPPPRQRLVRIPRAPETRLVLLGIAAIFALMVEGAVTDWSGVLLRDHLHASGGAVSYGYAAFCVTMTGGRFAGDRVVQALGRARCFAVLSVLGAVGLAAGMAAGSLVSAVAGFAVLGLGLSIMVPVLFSTAADTDGPAGPAIAAVAALGCVGMLAGPSLIGLVAQFSSVPAALYLLPPFTLIAGILGVAGVRLSARRKQARASIAVEPAVPAS